MKTSKSVDQVMIQPDGKWTLNDTNRTLIPAAQSSSINYDDELIEVTKTGTTVYPTGAPNTHLPRPTIPLSNPLSAQHDYIPNMQPGPSNLPQGNPSMENSRNLPAISNNKRQIVDVIDLTSDDDEPIAKRRNLPTSYSNYSLPSMNLPFLVTPYNGAMQKPGSS